MPRKARSVKKKRPSIKRKSPAQEGIYPWDQWFNRRTNKPLILKKGKATPETRRTKEGPHFKVMEHSMAQQVRNQANARGVLVSIAIETGQLTVHLDWE